MRTAAWRFGVCGLVLVACGFPEFSLQENDAVLPDESSAGLGDGPSRLREAQLRAARLGTENDLDFCVGRDPCDCDGDGYLAKTATCAGNDCDDHDPRIHPDASFLEMPATRGHSGDSDCDGTVDKRYAVKLDCADLLGCNESAQGFETDPPCGASADFYKCSPSLLSCEAVKIGQRVQACK